MSGEHTLKAVRGSFIDVTRTVDNPEEIASALRFIEDGLLLIKQGKVEWFGEWEDGKHQIPGHHSRSRLSRQTDSTGLCRYAYPLPAK